MYPSGRDPKVIWWFAALTGCVVVAMLALAATSTPVEFALAALSPASLDVHEVTLGRHAAVSPAEALLAYDTFDGLWLHDNGDTRQLLIVGQGFIQEPTFAPSGRQLAYVRHQDTGEGLYVFDLDSESERLLLEPDRPFLYMQPAWSHDGESIALVRLGPSTELGGNAVEHLVCIYDLASKSLDCPVAGEHPCWSPDDSRLAYQRNGDGGSEIWILSLETANSELVGPGMQPAWSPDGLQLAFTDQRAAKGGRILQELWVIAVQGRHRHRLTDALRPLATVREASAVAVGTPTWSLREPIDYGLHAEYDPAWSVVPRGLYFSAYLRSTGDFHIYFLPLPR